MIEFLLPRESDTWLMVLRFGLGLQVVAYSLTARSDWMHIFGQNANGLIRRELAEAVLSAESALAPRLGWLVGAGNYAGLSEERVLALAWLFLLVSGCCLLLGLFCRGAAITAWFLYLCAVGSGELFLYGVDNFTTIGLFYLMIAPLPDKYALDVRLWNTPMKDPQLLGLHRRVLQLHLCIAYFFSGVAKCLGTGWWNGTNIWRALTRPPFNIISPEILVSWRYCFPLAGIVICLLEIGYSFFIWPDRTRCFWLVCILGMHIGIAIGMGMYLFSLVMIVLNLAAFGPDFIRLPFRASMRLFGARE
jgi:hypothetical protein